MSLGVRTFSNTLLSQNIYNPVNLPDTSPLLKAFAYRILEPTLLCSESDCETPIGRPVQVPEAKLVGLISLEDNKTITNDQITQWILDGEYVVRVRDTGSCLASGGFCQQCGVGYMHRIGDYVTIPVVGESYTFESSARSYQNYIASTYSGALMGWSEVSADPLPAVPELWESVTSHKEMDKMSKLLLPLGLQRDEYNYVLGVEDILERALLIIGYYGVYGNV